MMTNQPDQNMPSQGHLIDPETDDGSTGLPGFKAWRSVYLFVIVVFLACVILLKIFELAFS
jgi:hypothetical protein